MISLINKYQKMFCILEKWKIEYENDGVYFNQCSTHRTKRLATIYPKEDGQDLDQYVFHEILHICQKEIRKGVYAVRREKEELFIEDLCEIVKKILY